MAWTAAQMVVRTPLFSPVCEKRYGMPQSPSPHVSYVYSSGERSQLGMCLHVPFRQVVRNVQMAMILPFFPLRPFDGLDSLVHLVPQGELPWIVHEDLSTSVHHVRVCDFSIGVAESERSAGPGRAEGGGPRGGEEPVSSLPDSGGRSPQLGGRRQEHSPPHARLQAQNLVHPAVKPGRPGRPGQIRPQDGPVQSQRVRVMDAVVHGPLEGGVHRGHGPGRGDAAGRRHLALQHLLSIEIHDRGHRAQLRVAKRPTDVRSRSSQ
mmetsp:Transcript_32707/g.75272  ORF Transcript_32707/g.75272 Transcript_32707/m.75272 type:complete len:264 (+) Transcript_32707:177-968(+)